MVLQLLLHQLNIVLALLDFLLIRAHRIDSVLTSLVYLLNHTFRVACALTLLDFLLIRDHRIGSDWNRAVPRIRCYPLIARSRVAALWNLESGSMVLAFPSTLPDTL